LLGSLNIVNVMMDGDVWIIISWY